MYENHLLELRNRKYLNSSTFTVKFRAINFISGWRERSFVTCSSKIKTEVTLQIVMIRKQVKTTTFTSLPEKKKKTKTHNFTSFSQQEILQKQIDNKSRIMKHINNCATTRMEDPSLVGW